MIKITKEPLLYFLLLGGALFLLFQQVSDNPFSGDAPPEEIVVSAGRIQALSQGFEKVWQRSPTQQEMQALIQNYVREEVLYREALAMGLDRDDAIVRRRMRQKMEFLSEDIAALDPPDEAELQAYLDANPETYRQPTRFSFRQVYLNPANHAQDLEKDVMELLASLRSNDTDAIDAGESMMLEHEFQNASERDIERALGRQFLQQLRNSQTGSWQGPIRSGFGLHLVFISQRIDGQIPRLAEVRDEVLRDWSARKRKQTNEAIYQAFRKRYKVIITGPGGEAVEQSSLLKVEN